MDSNSKSCQDLNNQLAIYQAFRNVHGVAAVLRQMANEHCPVQKMVIRELAHRRGAAPPARLLHRSPGLDGVMAKHPPLGYSDGLAWRHQVEGADLDPLRVDRGHGGFEVTEPLLLL